MLCQVARAVFVLDEPYGGASDLAQHDKLPCTDHLDDLRRSRRVSVRRGWGTAHPFGNRLPAPPCRAARALGFAPPSCGGFAVSRMALLGGPGDGFGSLQRAVSRGGGGRGVGRVC